MTENRFALDTNTVIFLSSKGNVIPSSLMEELNNADLFISVITEIELFAKPVMSFNEEESLRAFLSDRIMIVDLTGDIKKEAIAIRRTTGLKLPDCIVAATSIILDSTLLTSDKGLLRLKRDEYKARNII